MQYKRSTYYWVISSNYSMYNIISKLEAYFGKRNFSSEYLRLALVSGALLWFVEIQEKFKLRKLPCSHFYSRKACS